MANPEHQRRMANPEHLAILRQGVKAWNQWRRDCPQVTPHLYGVKFTPEDVRLHDLSGIDLRDANLHHATMNDVNLRKADLTKAHLVLAYLRHSNVTGANLDGANLSGADLFGANLTSASLIGTNLRGAELGSTVFGSVDLSRTEGLEFNWHFGPSTLGIDSVYASKGRFPDTFLRGIGVPEQFSTYMQSFVVRPVQFYSCFISYSTLDQAFADRLFADLQAKGVRCWFAPHSIHAGQKIYEQIDEAIRIYDKMLLILSQHSMNSNWVKTEIANARAKEQKQKRQMLFPITVVPFDCVRAWKCFDAETGIDTAREVREYFVPDFSNWDDHRAYRVAFQRLLRDLKTEPKEGTR